MSCPWPENVANDDWSSFRFWLVSATNVYGDPYQGVFCADTGPNAVIACLQTVAPMFQPLTGITFALTTGPNISTAV